jgi:hypothetical protein
MAFYSSRVSSRGGRSEVPGAEWRGAADADLGWALRRAFRIASSPPADGAAAAGELAWDALRAEVGAEGARRLAVDRASAEAREAQILELATTVAATADAPVVLLKFAALRASGAIVPGTRHAADLDVLVSEGAAEGLAGRLERSGFTRSAVPGFEHHLPALVHPRLGMVEIHWALPGVRVDRRRFARRDDLERAGLLVPATCVPHACAPRADVLAAHAIAHGLLQHGSAPASYPPLQMVADLFDLGLEVTRAGARWTARDLPPKEGRAVEALLAALAAGDLPEPGAGARLLERMVRGALDPRFRRGLKLAFARPLSDRPWLRARAAHWRRVFFPSAAELRILYGPEAGPAGLAGQRARRPFDVAWRTVRSLAARVPWRRG